MSYELDFLAVGDGEKSGDAIALRFSYPNTLNDGWAVVVVDGGYQDTGKKLVKHIQTYFGTDRVDLAVSTHPDADHVNGLLVVLGELEVGELLMHLPWNHVPEIGRSLREGATDMSDHLRESLQGACELEAFAEAKGIPITEPFAGLQRFGGTVAVVGPTQAYYEELVQQFRGVSLVKAREALVKRALVGAVRFLKEALDIETLDDGGETTAENNTSTIIHLILDGNRWLLTGDAGMPALTEAADRMDVLRVSPAPLSFMQVPHHGSRHNVGPTVLNRLLGPPNSGQAGSTAFVSVSAEAPKLPSGPVVNAFVRRGANVFATSGNTVSHRHEVPSRPGWIPATPIPFQEHVEGEPS
jgi:beta-lactamase superfamily II metal-dependent hydrolase